MKYHPIINSNPSGQPEHLQDLSLSLRFIPNRDAGHTNEHTRIGRAEVVIDSSHCII